MHEIPHPTHHHQALQCELMIAHACYDFTCIDCWVNLHITHAGAYMMMARGGSRLFLQHTPAHFVYSVPAPPRGRKMQAQNPNPNLCAAVHLENRISRTCKPTRTRPRAVMVCKCLMPYANECTRCNASECLRSGGLGPTGRGNIEEEKQMGPPKGEAQDAEPSGIVLAL